MAKALAELRALAPDRPLGLAENYYFAERIATRLIELAAITAPPVPELVIRVLEHVETFRTLNLPTSAASDFVDGKWVIMLDAGEPRTRSKYNVGHELYHIVMSGLSTPQHANHLEELLADHFAACLWMPRDWVTTAWHDNERDALVLARLFEVSVSAMRLRLQTLGLMDKKPRCAFPPPFGDAA